MSPRRASKQAAGASAKATGAEDDARAGQLKDYRAKRDFATTPEPGEAPAGDARKRKRPRKRATHAPRFVIHEHSATRLHWDLRLERDGVLASWAVPKGLPQAPGEN
ncbi:MAG TPA: DNA polymerase ligase N-terminal domain-containing protein, partial [Solirubrobacteraceae bacterium]